jgi:site-specific DNA recombinase
MAIIPTLNDDAPLSDVPVDLSGILAVSLKSKAPASGAGAWQVELVAGARFELTTFRL